MIGQIQVLKATTRMVHKSQTLGLKAAFVVISMCGSVALAQSNDLTTLFEVLEIKGENLHVKLRSDVGLHLLDFPDEMPRSLRKIDQGEVVIIPLGRPFSLLERHRGIKFIPSTSQGKEPVYQVEKYEDNRSFGGDLIATTGSTALGDTSGGVRRLRLIQDAGNETNKFPENTRAFSSSSNQ